jgi:proteasome assembly chaperone (PAC2) family protein
MDISDLLTDFKLTPPDLKLKSPHAIAVHIGWLNWGSVGDEVINELIDILKAEKIAEFERPGDFYNFVALRDYSRTYTDSEGNRHVEFPNSRIYYAKRKEPLNDLILLNLLEPTQFGEIFTERVVGLMKNLNVLRYEVVGAMGSSFPHTRPIVISGRGSDPGITAELERLGVRQRSIRQYEGPTSIFNLISPKLQNEGVTTVNLIANLPSYFDLQEADWNGVYSILKILAKLEAIEMPLGRLEAKAEGQYKSVTKQVHASDELSAAVKEMEEEYDREESKLKRENETKLPPNIQQALNEILGQQESSGGENK